MTPADRAWLCALLMDALYLSALLLGGYLAATSRRVKALARRTVRALFAGPASILDVLNKEKL